MVTMSRTPVPLLTRPRIQSLLLLGLLFVIVLLVALSTLPPLANGQADRLRSHLTDDVLVFEDTLVALEDDLQQMQAAARGYLLTGQSALLDQYRAGQEALPERFALLAELAPRLDPALVAEVTALRRAVAAWQDERGERPISLAQQDRGEEARVLLMASSPASGFPALQRQVEDLQEQASRAEAQLLLQINRIRLLQISLSTGLGILGVLAVGFVVVGFRRLVLLTNALDAQHARTSALAATAQAERQRLQAVFDHSPQGILVADAPDGRVALLNQAAATLLQTPLAATEQVDCILRERVQRPDGTPFPADGLPVLRSLQRGVTERNVELSIVQPDGSFVPVLMTSVPLVAADGVVRGAVAVIQDLRQLRAVERLKSDFVSLVSHELRTPLTAIQGCAQTLLADTALDSRRRHEFVQLIVEQGERLHELIENLLSLSQVEAGSLRLRRDLIHPQALVEEVLRQFRAQQTGLRLQADLAPNLPLLSVDRRRIEQVLFNLLDNARKFSPPGGVITVQAEQRGDELLLAVCDQGPGIPEAERERVFERFYQVARPDAPSAGGTGLGLAICKTLVEAHGGRIWAAATPGGGARLACALPIAAAHAPQPPRTEVLLRPEASAPQVLVVDDDPAVRRLLGGMLPAAGYRVETASEPQEALELITRHPPDVVVLDVMLPGTDGVTLCKQLREWTSVPIILLTAKTAERDVVRGLRQGADDYVTKPFRRDELLARIEAVARRAQRPAGGEGPALIQVGALRIDLASRAVYLEHAPIALTPTEYAILAYLARHAGQVLTHEQILNEIWGAPSSRDTQQLWVHIAHLRRKLEPGRKRPRYIVTERGIGYRLAKTIRENDAQENGS